MRTIRMFTTMKEEGIEIFKTPLAIYNMQMQRRKVSFIKTSQTLPNYQNRTFFIVFFSSDIFLRIKFLCSFFLILYWQVFRVFFSETFFPVTFLHRFLLHKRQQSAENAGLCAVHTAQTAQLKTAQCSPAFSEKKIPRKP